MDSPPTLEPACRSLAQLATSSDDRLRLLRRELVELRDRQRRAATLAVAELAEFAHSDRAPRELRAVQLRIDRGELTWERVALGEAGVLHDLLGDRLTSLAGLPEAVARARELVEGGLTAEEAVRRTRAELTGGADPAGRDVR